MKVLIEPRVLAVMFVTGNKIDATVTDGIPEGYQLAETRYDKCTGLIELILHSANDHGEEVKRIEFSQISEIYNPST